MVVKIRFGRGPVVTRRKGKNSRIALLAASLLTLVSICLASLGIWRLAQDVGLAGDFIFPDGFLSHWQVWIGAAAVGAVHLLAADPVRASGASGGPSGGRRGEEKEPAPSASRPTYDER